jgi:hypothetical protein
MIVALWRFHAQGSLEGPTALDELDRNTTFSDTVGLCEGDGGGGPSKRPERQRGGGLSPGTTGTDYFRLGVFARCAASSATFFRTSTIILTDFKWRS